MDPGPHGSALFTHGRIDPAKNDKRKRTKVDKGIFLGLDAGGHKEMSSILADQLAPSHMSPNAGEGGRGVAEYSCAH